MTDHPITPPPELVEQWRREPEYAYDTQPKTMVTMTADRWIQYWKTSEGELQKARDEELEACCDWLGVQETRSPQWFDLRHDACALVSDLRAARRPKPPSLKEQALEALAAIEGDFNTVGDRADTIRRALESLPND